jgi:hypothetical protein
MKLSHEEFAAVHTEFEETVWNAGVLINKIWEHSGSDFTEDGFELYKDGDIEIYLSRFAYGDEERESVRFPLEWLWSGGPGGDLETTFRIGHQTKKAERDRKHEAAIAAADTKVKKQELAELERLAKKYAPEAEEFDEFQNFIQANLRSWGR